MVDLFSSAKLKLLRARSHLNTLTSEFEAVWPKFDMVGYQITPSHCRYELNCQPLPMETIMGWSSDAVQNMRSALDQAVTASVRSIRGNNGASAYFCFAETSDKLNERIASDMKQVHPDIIDLVKRVGPVKNQNPELWAVNKLCTMDKHNWTIPPTIESHATAEDGTVYQAHFDPDKNQVVFEVPNHHIDGLKWHFFVAFDGIEAVAGKPLFALLQDQLSVCESIVVAIEAETSRITKTMI
jgi:hypothetical protein